MSNTGHRHVGWFRQQGKTLANMWDCKKDFLMTKIVIIKSTKIVIKTLNDETNFVISSYNRFCGDGFSDYVFR